MTNKSDNNKDKLRVYEYAKSLNMSSKEIITIMKRLDIPVNNHMSVMENDAVTSVEKFFNDLKSNAAAKRASETPKAAAPATATTPVKQTAPAAGSTDKSVSEQAAKPTAVQSQPAAQVQSQQQTSNARPNHSASNNQQGSGQRSNDRGGNYPRRDGRPQGQGNYAGNRDGAQRGQGGQNRPYGQGQGQGGQGSSRPQGQSGQGSNRPSYGNNQGGQSANRPQQGGQRDQQQRSSQSAPAASSRSAADQGQRRLVKDKDSFDSKRSNFEDANGNKKGKAAPNRFDDNKKGSFKGGAKGNNKFGKGHRSPEPKKEKIDNTPKKIIVRGTMTVGETAKLLHKDASEVIKKLLFLGVMATINQELDLDTIQLIATEFGVEVELKIPVEEDKFELVEEKDDEADLKERPPVVTIMGHVDHGKTTLLDAIRHTSVTEGEAGGITQHIGAYQVDVNGKKITFLDTPGHEAFTTMRARGAQVTDITIIVVAADDGVMPQTKEAIAHAKAAQVPIIVAVNKIDKPAADVDKIKQSLTEYELVPEEWGGDTIFCEVSAKQRIGLENLLEMILLVAEVQEYKANPNKRARGTIIEAELDKGRGPVARLLIQHGTLAVGDSFVAGVCFGRVRAMVNDKGKRLKEAGPSTPVEITGLTEVPQAGDPFIVFEDERKARDIAEKRAIALKQSEVRANSRVTLEELYKHIQEGEVKDLNVIIKGDVQGSVEALKGSLEKIEVAGVRVKIILNGVGAITESDIILASASNAIVIGFNVRPEPQAKNTAELEKVDIRLHRIIYTVIEEIEQAMKGMLDPVYKENVIGHAEVRNVFKVTGSGTIAGCMITQGKISRNAEVRLIRNGIVILEGKIDSLKRFKDDVKEVAQGYECGISLEKFNDIKEGDIIEAFIMETVER
ncbi:translation initiation factor IF-2 [Paenibacillus albiflavus]|uniref:Translation initiation factor IF-2 n=2 Tax=Paenibacillus albiflavus TaxID=2545760 RepID=A0A4R4EIL9_9BACL|nr:translation initiation factor IF-2 [Paenibacillus albiflavus]TCZ80004.1 translation initiation factor IF-2 [Paenibacillus albiflavus]